MPVKKTNRKAPPADGIVDSSPEFEELIKDPNRQVHFVFRLYITGNTVRSSQAIANIRTVCEDYLAGRYELEVVDIYQQPSIAAREQVIAVPTLIKKLPAPVKRLIGDLADRDKILIGLDLRKVDDISTKPGTKH